MTDKQLEQIEQYLAGELKGAELQKFEEKLKQDQDFYNTVLAQQHINDTLADKGLMRFMKTLKKAEAAFYAKKNRINQLIPSNNC